MNHTSNSSVADNGETGFDPHDVNSQFLATKTWKTVTSVFDVAIPTIDGKSVAYTVPVEVVCEIEPHSGEEILTPESLALIEKTKARHMGRWYPEERGNTGEGL